MSEVLHSEIFSVSTMWSNYKELRKIKDYYKSNITFDSTSVSIFILELIDVCNKITGAKCELESIIKHLQFKDIKSIRVCGD